METEDGIIDWNFLARVCVGGWGIAPPLEKAGKGDE